MANNTTDCDFEYYSRIRSDGFQIYSWIHLIFVAIVIAVSLLLWLKKRKSFYLKNRFGPLVFISSLGLCLGLITGPASRFLGQNLPCVLDLFAYYSTLPVLIWPMIIRLYIWVNKVKFNYIIAQKVADEGLSEINTNSRELLRYRLLASRRYGIFLTLITLVPYMIVIYFFVQEACLLCQDFFSTAFILFSIATFSGILLATWALYINREVPDPTELRKETKYAAVWCASVGFPALVLQFINVGGFSTAVPQRFDWAIFIDYALLAFFIFTVTFPVYKSFSAKSSKESEELKDFLSTERGSKFFELYLATELSLENLLFYNSVNEWKKTYMGDSKESSERAKAIYDTYFGQNNYLELNIGYTFKQEIAELIRTNAVEITLFDQAQQEIVKLMANHSFESFKASDFYKLYSGEIDADEALWITASGYSAYAFLPRNSISDQLLLK